MATRVAVMWAGVAVCSTSPTQHLVTLSTVEPEYVAMAQGAKERMSVSPILSSYDQGSCRDVRQSMMLFVVRTTRGLRLWRKTLSVQVAASTYMPGRWHFIQLGEGKRHQDGACRLRGQYADILMKPLSVSLLKRHRRALKNMGYNE